MVECARVLSTEELEERICVYFGCDRQEHRIAQPAP